MKIRGLLKKSAAVAGIAAIPSLASAATAEDTIDLATGGATTAQVTITLEATVAGSLRLEVSERLPTSGAQATTVDVSTATPDRGLVDFGTIDATGTQSGSTNGRIVTLANDAFFIAELEARTYFTGISAVDIDITGSQPALPSGANTTADPIEARWACEGQTQAAGGAWGTQTYGELLGTAGNCYTFDIANTGTAAGTENGIDVDLAFLVQDTTANGDYVALYTFTANPTIL